MASLEESGLTGRGGGAFPTSVKLGVSQSGGHGGIVVVNAMEGEPASSKDQLLLTRTPHLVLDPKGRVVTFGCRLNVYESEVMKEHGFAFSPQLPVTR